MYEGTYSPDDNKLRLRAGGRLPRDVYDQVRAAGYIWAPKQDLFVAPMWTPEREDLLLELCGEIGDEDTSLVDRAEERSERFDQYRENRTRDAQSAHAAVEAITDGIPLGQPILVGHHSERHARKDQERIENGMRKALKMWKTAEYWKYRAAGAIRHAKYKELPAVRARRIKTIEADRRKRERIKVECENAIKAWGILYALSSKTGEAPTDEVIRKRALYILNGSHSYQFWSDLDHDRITVREAMIKSLRGNARGIERCRRWIEHYDRRLDYEKAMLAEAGASELIAPKPRRKGNTIFPICNYRAPEGITCSRFDGGRDVQTFTQVEMTAAEYAKIYSEDKGTRVVDHSHRVRVAIIGGWRGAMHAVFITDSKVHAKPAPGTPPEPKPRRIYTPPAPREKTEAEIAIEALQAGVTAGVQVVSAPQLFPTPAEVARRMVDIADIQAGECVLEPSAGTGNLVQAVVDAGIDTEILAYEINGALVQKLAGRWPSYRVQVRRADFLEVTDHQGCYPKILMNPPFINGADIKHIEHARTFLRPGGVLVGICAGGPRQREKYGNYIVQELPPGTFEGTGVTSLIIRIEA